MYEKDKEGQEDERDKWVLMQPFEYSPYDQKTHNWGQQEVRRTKVRWISADGSEHSVESSDQDEITIRCMTLIMKWARGEVIKIIIEE